MKNLDRQRAQRTIAGMIRAGQTCGTCEGIHQRINPANGRPEQSWYCSINLPNIETTPGRTCRKWRNGTVSATGTKCPMSYVPVPKLRLGALQSDLAFYRKAVRILGVAVILLVILVLILVSQARGEEIPSVFLDQDSLRTEFRIAVKGSRAYADSAGYFIDIHQASADFKEKAELVGWLMINDSTRLYFILGEKPLLGPPAPTLWEKHKPFWKAVIGAVSIVVLWGVIS